MAARFHLFTLIHKGLRNALQQTVWSAGRLDIADREDREAFIKQFKQIATMLHQHAKDEDTYIQPLIDQCAPAISEQLEIQHQRSEQLLERLEAAVDSIEGSESISAETWQSFLDMLNRFVGDYYLHLYHEESVAMPALWESFTDETIMAAGMELRKNVPPHIQSNFQRYMFPALNIQEQTIVLTGVKQSAPEPVFQDMCRLFESLLSAEEWERLRARVAAATA